MTTDERPTSPYVAYLEDCRRPIVCLFFTLPLFLVYHVGIYLIDTQYQNGADFILTKALQAIGYGGQLLSFLFVLLVLGFQQQFASTPWSRQYQVFFWMTLESLLFALPIFLIANILSRVLGLSPETLSAIIAPAKGRELPWSVEMVLSLGAGLYEEFLFRFVLMGLMLWLANSAFGRVSFGMLCFILIFQAVLFSGFHHIPGSLGAPPTLEVFAFRTLSGVYFGYIFLSRGFGIVAGAHAFYDVIVVSLKSISEWSNT